MNLLTNAIKYAPNTERIDVRLRRVGDMAEIEVRDRGMGIAAGDLTHIFAHLFQTAQARQTAPTGLGLGLYLARELVEAHNGSITVESTEGKGTTFTVRLPLVAAGDDRLADA
jgi:two-component system CheB/CheR fusion protein